VAIGSPIVAAIATVDLKADGLRFKTSGLVINSHGCKMNLYKIHLTRGIKLSVGGSINLSTLLGLFGHLYTLTVAESRIASPSG